MDSKEKALISRGLLLVQKSLTGKRGRKRYPTELRQIVRSLAVEHSIPPTKIAKLLCVSHSYASVWSAPVPRKRTRKARTEKAFKKISVDERPDVSEQLLNLVKVLRSLLILQALTLACFLLLH